MGRKKIEWTEEQFRQIEQMAQILATEQEICNVMGVNDRTLMNNIKKHYGVSNFPEWFDKYSAQGKISLRRLQFETAKSGNPTMQIWLGKQHLDQKEPKNDVEIDNTAIAIDKIADLLNTVKNDVANETN